VDERWKGGKNLRRSLGVSCGGFVQGVWESKMMMGREAYACHLQYNSYWWREEFRARVKYIDAHGIFVNDLI